MKTGIRARTTAALASALVLAAGCGGDVTADRSAPRAAHPPDPKSRAARHLAMSPGKPTAPVSLRVAGDSFLPAKAPAGLTLVLRAGAAAEAVTLTLEGGAGVELIAPVGPLLLGPVAAGRAIEVPVQLIASEGDPPRLAALVLLEAGGQQQAKSFSVNLPVDGIAAPGAPAVPASKPAPARDATGELVQSMQAETRIQ